MHRVEEIMGIPVGIEVRAGDVPASALDRAFAHLRWVDATFSTYRAESEIRRVDAGTLALRDAHPAVREVLACCERLRADTRGFFDARAAPGGALDPSGLVKGWALETVAGLLRSAGATCALVHAGGDLRAIGGPWRVGVQHPLRRDALADLLVVHDAGVATSGAYERGPHVVDPHTGRPPAGVLSVTVVGADLGPADAYATAAFAMGRDGPAFTAALDGHEALTILDDGRTLATPGLPLAGDDALTTAAAPSPPGSAGGSP